MRCEFDGFIKLWMLEMRGDMLMPEQSVRITNQWICDGFSLLRPLSLSYIIKCCGTLKYVFI